MSRLPVPRLGCWFLAVWASALAVGPALATPLDYLPVGDPLEDEIRLLDVLGSPLRLPRLGMRPLQVVDLPSQLPDQGASAISSRRLLRAFARDRGGQDTVTGVSHRLLQIVYPEEQRLELSAGFEGGGRTTKGRDPELVDGSGLHIRVGTQTGRWLAYAHLIAGHFQDGPGFAERILSGWDAVLHSQETYLAYTGQSERWAATLGRGRWQWGPGQEGSLLLSKTSAPFTALAFRMRIEPLRADGMVLNATLQGSAGEQLAAHRLEWQPRDGLRVGLSEAARFHSTSFQPIYLIGVLPYSLAQNLLVQDEPDSERVLRNNVTASADVAWRIVPGSRVYAEILVDDLKTDSSPIVNKYGYQLGWEGVGTVRGTRVWWGSEVTRLSRFVYTSFFGRSFEAAGRPLGFLTGPDARRIRVRLAWDPNASWQVFSAASHTELGESGLGVPFVPGSPRVNSSSFAGVVEVTRDAELGLRYWPASGLDLAVSVGYRWVDDEEHVVGRDRREPRAELQFRWTR